MDDNTNRLFIGLAVFYVLLAIAAIVLTYLGS